MLGRDGFGTSLLAWLPGRTSRETGVGSPDWRAPSDLLSLWGTCFTYIIHRAKKRAYACSTRYLMC